MKQLNFSVLATAAALLPASMAQAISLDFDQAVQSFTQLNQTYGFIVETTTIDFLDVATDNGVTVDARITATVGANTNFGGGTASGSQSGARTGYMPNYNAPNGTAEPNDDLGFLFGGLGEAGDAASVSLTFEFFDGTGGLSGSFSTAFVAPELELMVYDVDGEPEQDETFRAHKGDGLVSYQLANSAGSVTAADQGGSVLFTGPGTNLSETDASAAVILQYENTDSFVLDFVATKNSGTELNAVFTAIDGDLSLADPNDFGAPVGTTTGVSAVPLPATAWFFVALGIFPLLRRRQSA